MTDINQLSTLVDHIDGPVFASSGLWFKSVDDLKRIANSLPEIPTGDRPTHVYGAKAIDLASHPDELIDEIYALIARRHIATQDSNLNLSTTASSLAVVVNHWIEHHQPCAYTIDRSVVMLLDWEDEE